MEFSELSDADLATFARALHEARFPELENDPVVWSAPFVIQLHSDLIAEHARRVDQTNDENKAEQLRSWLEWRGRAEHATVLRRLRESSSLRERVRSNPDFMRDVLRPFNVDDETIEEFLRVASSVDGQ